MAICDLRMRLLFDCYFIHLFEHPLKLHIILLKLKLYLKIRTVSRRTVVCIYYFIITYIRFEYLTENTRPSVATTNNASGNVFPPLRTSTLYCIYEPATQIIDNRNLLHAFIASWVPFAILHFVKRHPFLWWARCVHVRLCVPFYSRSHNPQNFVKYSCKIKKKKQKNS